MPEDLSPFALAGVGVMVALLLVWFLNWRLQQLPDVVGQRRRQYLIAGSVACGIGLAGAYGVYAFWLKKPSADLLMLNRAFRFKPRIWLAGEELELEFSFAGGEQHGRLLTMILLKDEAGIELAHQEKSLGHAGEQWDKLRFQYKAKAGGKYQLQVFTPDFVEDVQLTKGPADF